eukprot:3006838-Amphidinium_carterae.1
MSRLKSVRYTEKYALSAIGKQLSARAYPAGGQLGSAYWTLQSGNLTALYLVDYSLRSGLFLDGMDLKPLLKSKKEEAALRWDIVITSPPLAEGLQTARFGASQMLSKSSNRVSSAPRTAQEEVLLEDTIAALRRGGTVLVPADVVSKALDVLLLFEQAWAADGQLASNYPLIWLSSVGDMVLDQAKTRLEYMSNEVLSKFETRIGTNPF